jgi:hypothetical protein
MNQEDHYNELIDWAGIRIDYLLSRSSACKTKSRKIQHRLNAQALEEEFFDWFAARHSDSKQNVLFIPYHGNFKSP